MTIKIDDNMALNMGNKLFAMRDERGLSQEDLGEKIEGKVAQSAEEKKRYQSKISNLENGHGWTPKYIYAVCEYFDVSADWLTGRTNCKRVLRFGSQMYYSYVLKCLNTLIDNKALVPEKDSKGFISAYIFNDPIIDEFVRKYRSVADGEDEEINKKWLERYARSYRKIPVIEWNDWRRKRLYEENYGYICNENKWKTHQYAEDFVEKYCSENSNSELLEKELNKTIKRTEEEIHKIRSHMWDYDEFPIDEATQRKLEKERERKEAIEEYTEELDELLKLDGETSTENDTDNDMPWEG